MTKFCFLFLIFYLQFHTKSNGQCDCFTNDTSKSLVYNKADSSLYTGTCNEYYRKGNPKGVCDFQDGIIKSCRYWNKKGKLIDSIIYLDGYAKILTYNFYSTGQLKHTGSYEYFKTINSQKNLYVEIGTHKYFRENGNKKNEVDYKNCGNTMYQKEYYKNGNLRFSGTFYKEDTSHRIITILLHDSTHNTYRKDGTIESSINYKKNKKQGISKSYYSNGSIKEERTYVDGTFINPALFWDSEGRRFEITYNIVSGEPSSEIYRVPKAK
jgi:antitoxin component YwqK of YwqJK toxin-antitoxin module